MSESTLGEQEVLDVLHAIERREVTIPEEQRTDASAAYVNNVEYTCSNGWRFVVFNDCDEWDYIDTVETPDGRSLDFDTIWDTMPTLREYRPPVGLAMEQWGIPS